MKMFSKAYRDFAKLPDVAQVMLALRVAMALAAIALVLQGMMSNTIWLLHIELELQAVGGQILTRIGDSEHGMQRWATVLNLVFLSAYVFTYLRFAQVHQNENALNAELYERKIVRVGLLSEGVLICILAISILVFSAGVQLRLLGVVLIHILYGILIGLGCLFSPWTRRTVRENRMCRFAVYLLFAIPAIMSGSNPLNLGLISGVIAMAILLHPLSRKALAGSRQSLDKKSAAWY